MGLPSSPLSVRLPLTSPDSIDIGRGSSTDLEAQSLRMVRDFDDPAAGEAAIRKSSITPNSPAGHPEEPLPPGLLGNPAPNHSRARLSSSQIYRETSLSLTNAPPPGSPVHPKHGLPLELQSTHRNPGSPSPFSIPPHGRGPLGGQNNTSAGEVSFNSHRWKSEK